jgi:hypothetical protein
MGWWSWMKAQRRLLEGRDARQMQQIKSNSEYKDDHSSCSCAYA